MDGGHLCLAVLLLYMGMGFVLRWVAPILKMTARPIFREKSELNCLDDVRARLLQRFF